MYKNNKKSGIFVKTLKILTYIKNKFKFYFLYNIARILPKTLLSRLIIYLMTTIFVIFLILIIFIYDKHWRKIRESLINGIANDIYYTSILLNNNYAPSNFISSIIYNTFYQFNIISNPSSSYIDVYDSESNIKLSKNAKILANILDKNLPYKFYIKENKKNNISVLVLFSNKEWAEFFISPKNVFFIKSLKTIAWYTFLLYVILIVVSYIFFKMLLRPLRQLSTSVSLFGKGEDVRRISPRGTIEIRNTIMAFNEMKERISRHIEQRTLLLSSISHDLKSALTKMSLSVELAETSEFTKDLQEEINNMNLMVSNYLTFAKNEFQEEPITPINIKNFFKNVIKPYKLLKGKKIKLNFDNIITTINAKPLTLKRAITNLLDNAVHYANEIHIKIKNTNKNYIKITIDDNGPGINSKNFKNVFKPFFRINAARTIKQGNVGLGLSIVKDAINKHGGKIILSKSHLKGLRVIILIPF